MSDRAMERNDGEEENDDDYEEEDDGSEPDEPILKYVRLTDNLSGVYRKGDATSASLVAGDKMIIGTHNGNIHVYSIPSLKPLRVYHAHGASVSAVAVSPLRFMDRAGAQEPAATAEAAPESPAPNGRTASASASPAGQGARKEAVIAPTRANLIHIASASIDGNVCVAALADNKDVHIRNFGRPVHAVALSPQYRSDRAYLSGGQAGRLILTVGGRPGMSTASTAATAAASTAASVTTAAAGWLGSLGFGLQETKDAVLHSGEGPISTIKWSFTGRYVAWVNEKGIKIMRSDIGLDSADADMAWKRVGHIDRPNGPGWEEMSGIWKSRVEWIDDSLLGNDDSAGSANGRMSNARAGPLAAQSTGHSMTASKGRERLAVGWGGVVWIIHLHPGRSGKGRDVGEKIMARAEIATIQRFDDCVVSGLTLLSPSLLVVLAFVLQDDDADTEASPAGSPRRETLTQASPQKIDESVRGRRQSALKPELRLIDMTLPGEEAVVSADSLSVRRFETLSPGDYHLNMTLGLQSHKANIPQKGRFESLGGDIWTASLKVTRGVFSSTVSVRSEDGTVETGASAQGVRRSDSTGRSSGSQTSGYTSAAHSAATGAGPKLYIHSPYDCIIAAKRDLKDHLDWLLEQRSFGEAWELVNDNPELVSAASGSGAEPVRRAASNDVADALTATDDGSVAAASGTAGGPFTAAEKEKRRIGEEWIKKCISAGDWAGAGAVCGKVLGMSARWEHWVWVFAQANRFEDITPYIPVKQLQPPLPSLVYEYVLGHYISHDRLRLKELLALWPPELFEIKTVTDAIAAKLRSGEVREDTAEGGERGRDWRILMEALAKLLVADANPREALKCYMRLKDADAVMALIRKYNLLDAVSDDIAGFLQLRVTTAQIRTASVGEVEEEVSEAMSLLVDAAIQGTVQPAKVVKQLQDQNLSLLLFFYLRALWLSSGSTSDGGRINGAVELGEYSEVDQFGDIAVELFAEYDRPLLLQFLKQSQSYTFEKACMVCQQRNHVPELVYLLSKTGETKRALFLIIDQLADVSQAIAFAKSQNDPDLWNDLLQYSMDKPRFIRGLLAEVGTAIDPVDLVRRIPEGLAIEGLKDGLSRMLKEFELQHSISEGVATILRGEVALVMEASRLRQVRGIKFDVKRPVPRAGAGGPSRAGPAKAEEAGGSVSPRAQDSQQPASMTGRCVGCQKILLENEPDTLVGFGCEHVFHLACLLDYQHKKDKDGSNGGGDPARGTEAYMQHLGGGGGGSMHSSRTVGAKVARARILRDLLADGCPALLHADDS